MARLLLLLPLLALSATVLSAHNNDQVAYAIPVEGITIDGRLDDWPDSMAVYPVAWVAQFWYKANDPPSGPEDLTASFRAGYDPAENVLLLAIIARDDDQVVRPVLPWYSNQDLCEIYVDGDHSGGDISGDTFGQGQRGTQQYAMVAGPSTMTPLSNGNPDFVGGDAKTSGIRAAMLRIDDYTVYEWSIPVFLSFPDERLDLRDGLTIGFDVVVADTDGLEDGGNWAAWTPEALKVSNSNRMGDLAFVSSYEELAVTPEPTAPVSYDAVGAVAGHVLTPDGGPFAGVAVGFWHGDEPVAGTTTDDSGAFSQLLPAGTYSVRSSPRGVKEDGEQTVDVIAGAQADGSLTLEDHGTAFHVDDDALADGDGSLAYPFSSIADAFDVTSAGDTIRVAAGTYIEPVEFRSGVTVIGVGPDSTVLSGQDKRRVVEIGNVHDVHFEGVAIVEGRAVNGPGGGLLLYNSRNVRIEGNVIAGNVSERDGAGVAVFQSDSTVVLTGNLIVGNRTERPESGGSPGGGGLYTVASRPEILHNSIVGNAAVGEGGGVLLEGAGARLRHNIVSGNLHGGIAFKGSYQATADVRDVQPNLDSNDVWHNESYDYWGLAPGADDLSVDPEFIDPAGGDFRLAPSSPLRGVGSQTAALSITKASVDVVGQLDRPAELSPIVVPVAFETWRLPDPHPLVAETTYVETQDLNLGQLSYRRTDFDESTGLPHNHVRSVAPAPDGSIWFGTEKGVARYDGLWTYIDSLDGLPSSEIVHILPEDGGGAWIATENGLAYYRDSRVSARSNAIFRRIVRDVDGALWMDGAESARWDTVWTYFSMATADGRTLLAYPHASDDSGLWWWANARQLKPHVIHRSASGVRAFELPVLQRSQGGWEHMHSFAVAEDGPWIAIHDSRAMEANWIRRVGRDIVHLNPDEGRLHVYRLPEDWHEETPRTLDVDGDGGLWAFSDQALLHFDGRSWRAARDVGFASYVVARDGDGSLWFGGRNGATRFGLPTWETVEGEDRLHGKQVTAIAEDREGRMWFGGEVGLLRRHADGSWERAPLADTLVTDLLVDRQDRLWASTAIGVSLFDGSAWTHFDTAHGLPDTIANSIAEDGSGQIWAGTGNGLHRFDDGTWHRVPLTRRPLRPWQSANEVLDLLARPDGGLWIATMAGLYTVREGRIRDYFEEFYPDRWFDVEALADLSADELTPRLEEVLQDSLGIAWLTARAQPYVSTPDSGWQQLSLSYSELVETDRDIRDLERRAREAGLMETGFNTNVFVPDLEPEWQALAMLGAQPIVSMYEGPGQEMAFVTSMGVQRFAGGEWSFERWAELPFQAEVRAGTVDRDGHLWLSTTAGAVGFQEDGWVRFDADDGLPANAVQQIHEDAEGTLWFATAKGIARYRPDRRPPQTRVARGPAERVGHGTSSLVFELEAGDRELGDRGLSFSCALLPEAQSPTETDWSDFSLQPFVQLVPPEQAGDYIFHVRARDKALNVDPTPATYVFRMSAPWWADLRFQSAAGLLLLLLVLSTSYSVKKRRQARDAERALIRELEAELETAQELQRSLMPKEPPQMPGLDVAGQCLSATRVGGDIFQFFVHGGRLTVAMADVTGHAMEAAIPVVMFSGILDNQMETPKPLDELYRRLNRSLCRTLGEHTFVCLSMVEIDSDTRALRVANSGCPFPLVFQAASEAVDDIAMEGYPLGVRLDTPYPVDERQLQPGDTIVLYSDGIPEAQNLAGEDFGYERVAAAVRSACLADLPAEAVVQGLLDAVNDFTGETPQADDMTCVVVRAAS